jgi:hypothetical protein
VLAEDCLVVDDVEPIYATTLLPLVIQRSGYFRHKCMQKTYEVASVEVESCHPFGEAEVSWGSFTSCSP